MGQIRDLQDAMAAWREYNFPGYTADQQFKGIVEEVGELAHADLKAEQGIRGMANSFASTEAKTDAIADLFIFLTGYCTREKIDLELAIIETWNVVRQRNWQLWPETGRPPEEVIEDPTGRRAGGVT